MIIEVLNVLSSVFCFYLLHVVRTIKVKGPEHTVLSWTLLALLWWNILAIFVYRTGNIRVVATLLPVSCIGMFFFFPLHLHFSYILWRKRSLPIRSKIILYVPAMVLTVVNIFVPVSVTIVPDPTGTIQLLPPVGSLVNAIWILYAASCWLLPIVWYLRVYRDTSFQREKRQSRLLIWGVMLTSVFTVSEYLAVIFFPSRQFPTHSPLLISLWVGTMVYAIWRYGLLRVSPRLLAEEILDSISDVVLLYNLDGTRVYANSRARSMLEIGQSSAAVATDPLTASVGCAIGNPRNWVPAHQVHSIRLHLDDAHRSGAWSPVDFLGRPVFDEFKDPIGLLVIGTVVLSVPDGCHEYHLTRRESEVIQYLSRGWTTAETAGALSITERTVKAHITSIYEKTGATNRVELLQALNGGRPEDQ